LDLIKIKENENGVEEGILFCSKCNRYFPIIEEIPIMLPDDLRDKKLEMEFLNKNKKNLPEKIIDSGKPWHL
jgi:uncharacterized protein YbaR (Trm112 family)